MNSENFCKFAAKFAAILVNALNCRFRLRIAGAFTRHTVQTAINYVCGYKLQWLLIWVTDTPQRHMSRHIISPHSKVLRTLLKPPHPVIPEAYLPGTGAFFPEIMLHCIVNRIFRLKGFHLIVQFPQIWHQNRSRIRTQSPQIIIILTFRARLPLILLRQATSIIHAN